MNLGIRGFIGYSTLEMHLRQKYGVVRSSDGKIYRLGDYGGYEPAMNACVRDAVIEHREVIVCGPSWNFFGGTK